MLVVVSHYTYVVVVIVSQCTYVGGGGGVSNTYDTDYGVSTHLWCWFRRLYTLMVVVVVGLWFSTLLVLTVVSIHLWYLLLRFNS